MVQNRTTSLDPDPVTGEPRRPDPALKRLETLVGKWELKGRTLDSDVDNITGWNTFEWMPGRFFLKSEGEINFKGFLLKALEIIAYDPKRNVFPSNVYSSMSGDVIPYEWDVQGSTLIHSGMGAAYKGTISQDGSTITGGWRPNEGTPETEGAAYDAVMTRVK
jgi:Protein of unknown function (DUF1579)